MSRWEDHIARYGEAPKMPPLDGDDHLLGYFTDLGFVMPAGMGIGPLTFTEIDAYARTTGGLLPFEAQTLRAMSVAYVSGFHAGKDIAEIPPWPVRDEKNRVIDDPINEGYVERG